MHSVLSFVRPLAVISSLVVFPILLVGQIDPDRPRSSLFWTQSSSGIKAIYFSNDESTRVQLVNVRDTTMFPPDTFYNPSGIAVWPPNVYWIDSDRKAIFSVPMEHDKYPYTTTEPLEPLVEMRDDSVFFFGDQFGRPVGDLVTNGLHLYWGDWDANAIYRANMDGSNPEMIVNLPQAFPEETNFEPSAMTLAFVNRIYWTDTRLDALFSCGLNGEAPTKEFDFGEIMVGDETRFTGAFANGVSLATDELETYVYWTDAATAAVYRREPNTLSPFELVADIPTNLIDPGFIQNGNPSSIVSENGVIFWIDQQNAAIFRAPTSLSGGNQTIRKLDLSGNGRLALVPPVEGYMPPSGSVSNVGWQVFEVSGSMTISWASSPGESFRVEKSTNMKDWSEVGDLVVATEAKTTFTYEDVSLPAEGCFLRVTKVE